MRQGALGKILPRAANWPGPDLLVLQCNAVLEQIAALDSRDNKLPEGQRRLSKYLYAIYNIMKTHSCPILEAVCVVQLANVVINSHRSPVCHFSSNHTDCLSLCMSFSCQDIGPNNSSFCLLISGRPFAL